MTLSVTVQTQPFVREVSAGSDSQQILELLLTAMPDDPERFKRHCARVADWDAVLKCAGRHGVEGILYHQLVKSNWRPSPAVKGGAEQHLAIERIRYSLLRRLLDEVLQTLDAAGVRVAALKGPLLAERIYPHPSLRPSIDLDLLVASGDFERATRALKAIGYQTEEGPSARYHRKHHHHIHLTRPQPPPVELHFRAFTGFGAAVASEPLLSRASPYPTATSPGAWVLSPEDEVLYLSLHAARHLFLRLAWLYDLKLFLRRYPDIDWSVVAARAHSYGLAAALSFTFGVLSSRLGEPIPDPAALAPRHKIRSRIAKRVHSATTGQPLSLIREFLGELVFLALLCESPATGARLLSHHLLRVARRRAQRYFPGAVPQEWSG